MRVRSERLLVVVVVVAAVLFSSVMAFAGGGSSDASNLTNASKIAGQLEEGEYINYYGPDGVVQAWGPEEGKTK